VRGLVGAIGERNWVKRSGSFESSGIGELVSVVGDGIRGMVRWSQTGQEEGKQFRLTEANNEVTLSKSLYPRNSH